jgi:hypothetical protein
MVNGRQTVRALRVSDQPHSLQTRMPAFADNDVVVHGDPERGGDIYDRLGHLDVGLRRRRIAGGVIVHQQTRSKIALENNSLSHNAKLVGDRFSVLDRDKPGQAHGVLASDCRSYQITDSESILILIASIVAVSQT